MSLTNYPIYRHEQDIEISNLKSHSSIIENNNAAWLSKVIETGNTNNKTYRGKRTNPIAFNQYLIKNNFIKFNETNKTVNNGNLKLMSRI